MSEHNQQATLQAELEKHRAAVADVSGKIAVLEAEEKRKREEKEKKEREFASLQSQLKACQDWILFVQKKITEVEESVATVLKASCSDLKNAYLELGGTLQELATRQLELAAFKTYAGSLREKLKDQ
jgi:chromosome segregation ATPase